MYVTSNNRELPSQFSLLTGDGATSYVWGIIAPHTGHLPWLQRGQAKADVPVVAASSQNVGVFSLP